MILPWKLWNVNMDKFYNLIKFILEMIDKFRHFEKKPQIHTSFFLISIKSAFSNLLFCFQPQGFGTRV